MNYTLFCHLTPYAAHQQLIENSQVLCHLKIYSSHETSEISGSHGDEYEDGCLLGRCVLMIKAVSTSETSVNYQTTRRNIQEVSHFINRRRENLKSHFVQVVSGA
jgi:hypothetical protein